MKKEKGGGLSLDDLLGEKHPKGKTLLPKSDTDDLYHDPIVFEQIIGEAIK